MYSLQQQQPAAGRVHHGDMIRVRDAGPADLQSINDVVSEATLSWGLAERVRRLALPSLHYSSADLGHMTVILLTGLDGEDIGLAAWESADSRDLPPDTEGVLLHGLYVVPQLQKMGLGTRLVDLVAHRAAENGANGIAVRAWKEAGPFFSSLNFEPLNADPSSDTYPLRLWKRIK